MVLLFFLAQWHLRCGANEAKVPSSSSKQTDSHRQNCGHTAALTDRNFVQWPARLLISPADRWPWFLQTNQKQNKRKSTASFKRGPRFLCDCSHDSKIIYTTLSLPEQSQVPNEVFSINISNRSQKIDVFLLLMRFLKILFSAGEKKSQPFNSSIPKRITRQLKHSVIVSYALLISNFKKRKGGEEFTKKSSKTNVYTKLFIDQIPKM